MSRERGEKVRAGQELLDEQLPAGAAKYTDGQA